MEESSAELMRSAIVKNNHKDIEFYVECCSKKLLDINSLVDGVPLLQYAVQFGDPETLSLVLSAPGATTNVFDINNNTPVMYAVMKGRADIVSFLLTFSVNVHHVNKENDTALTLAINALLDAKKDLNSDCKPDPEKVKKVGKFIETLLVLLRAGAAIGVDLPASFLLTDIDATDCCFFYTTVNGMPVDRQIMPGMCDALTSVEEFVDYCNEEDNVDNIQFTQLLRRCDELLSMIVDNKQYENIVQLKRRIKTHDPRGRLLFDLILDTIAGNEDLLKKALKPNTLPFDLKEPLLEVIKWKPSDAENIGSKVAQYQADLDGLKVLAKAVEDTRKARGRYFYRAYGILSAILVLGLIIFGVRAAFDFHSQRTSQFVAFAIFGVLALGLYVGIFAPIRVCNTRRQRRQFAKLAADMNELDDQNEKDHDNLEDTLSVWSKKATLRIKARTTASEERIQELHRQNPVAHCRARLLPHISQSISQRSDDVRITLVDDDSLDDNNNNNEEFPEEKGLLDGYESDGSSVELDIF